VIMVVVGAVALWGAQSNMSGNSISVMILVFLTSMLILGWYMDMISGVPLVMFSLLLAAVIGFKVFSNSANAAGGG